MTKHGKMFHVFVFHVIKAMFVFHVVKANVINQIRSINLITETNLPERSWTQKNRVSRKTKYHVRVYVLWRTVTESVIYT